MVAALPDLAGVHCVLFALFGADGRLDRGAMRAQAAWARAAGADGITVLGLATEVGKLAPSERLDVVAWAAEDAAGLPLFVTVAGADAAEARPVLAAAEAAGAALAILQPPAEGAGDLVEHFARVGEGASVPLAVQNAPAFLGRSLAGADVARLRARLPGLVAVKAELPAADLGAFRAGLGEGVLVLSGRGGIEMTDCLRAGARGFVVAPDVLDGVVACWRAWARGDEAGAEAAYAAFLPAATFGLQSLEHLHCYGKRVWGLRAGLPIHDRAPGLAPTALGLTLARRWAATGPRPT